MMRRTMVNPETGERYRGKPENCPWLAAPKPLVVTPERQRVNDPNLARIRAEQAEVFTAGKRTTVREGFVYIITNPAFPGYVKVGRALDPEDRLASFQTGDPLRRYKLEGYRYSKDRYAAEQSVHAALRPWWAGGEWFLVNTKDAIRALELIRM
jgi:hypothetical protein